VWELGPRFRLTLALGTCLLCVLPLCHSEGMPADWQAELHARVSARDLPAALQIVDLRLAETPQDLEARGWRARILAWSGRWKGAETDYRIVLAAFPQDVDMLVGLSYVLTWERDYLDALDVLNRAEEIEPARADIYLSRGRALRASGQLKESRLAFQKSLALNPEDQEAKDELTSAVADPRFTLSFGADFDRFNFTSSAKAFTSSLTAKISPRWTTNISIVGLQRFGQQAETFFLSAGYKLTHRDSITFGGGTATDQSIVPVDSAFLEYGHGFSLGEQFALETTYNQRWFWYHGARVMTLTPHVTLDLPKSWSWSLQLTEARSSFAGLRQAWRPSGLTRLSFPIHHTLTGNVFYAAGTEDFALVDQIGSFSAETFGSGLSYWFHSRHGFTGYLGRQQRSQGRTDTSFGASYAYRF
jgi:tetratricopeptide (TPR) repeat protein